jgi:hypothetical protein
MPASALARIHERRPPLWTSDLVERLLVEAYCMFPGRGIRANGGLSDALDSSDVSAVNILSFVGLISEDRDRSILLASCKRKATGNAMSQRELAEYWGLTRKGVDGVRKRAAKRFASELNDRGLRPLAIVEGGHDAAAECVQKVA